MNIISCFQSQASHIIKTYLKGLGLAHLSDLPTTFSGNPPPVKIYMSVPHLQQSQWMTNHISHFAATLYMDVPWLLFLFSHLLARYLLVVVHLRILLLCFPDVYKYEYSACSVCVWLFSVHLIMTRVTCGSSLLGTKTSHQQSYTMIMQEGLNSENKQ